MKVTGAMLVVLALAAAIVPLFTDCQSQGRSLALANGKEVAMTCHWTGRAELALSIPLMAMGLLMIFSRRTESLRSLSLTGIVTGVLMILVPTTLIGVCGSAQMLCNSVMRPTLILLGSLVIALGAAGIVQTVRRKEVPA